MKQDSLTPDLRNLHIVRGLAAFIVVVFHAKFALWVGGNVYIDKIGLHTVWDYLLFAVDMLSSCGEQCVVIFFILSAVVIRHSFDRYRNRLKTFYIIRLIRIYIPFACSLLLSVLVLFFSIRYINPDIYAENIRNYNLRIVHAADQFSVSQLINAIFFTGRGEYAGANFAYWSLGHELLFYIAFPLYMRFSQIMKYFLVLALIALFIITGWSAFYYQVYFIAGLLIYEYLINRNRPLLGTKSSVAAVVILFILVNLSLKVAGGWVADVLTVILCFVLFSYLLFRKTISKGLLTGLADISYTLYLVHLPLLLLFYATVSYLTGDLQFYARWPYYAGVVFALLMSIPLYTIIERPSIRLLKKMR